MRAPSTPLLRGNVQSHLHNPGSNACDSLRPGQPSSPDPCTDVRRHCPASLRGSWASMEGRSLGSTLDPNLKAPGEGRGRRPQNRSIRRGGANARDFGKGAQKLAGNNPVPRDERFLFPSMRSSGKVPLSSSVFVADHLRPAALAAGVMIPRGHRFGSHNLRHSHWLVHAARENPRTVQGILRHDTIETTLGLYTQSDMEWMIAAQ